MSKPTKDGNVQCLPLGTCGESRVSRYITTGFKLGMYQRSRRKNQNTRVGYYGREHDDSNQRGGQRVIYRTLCPKEPAGRWSSIKLKVGGWDNVFLFMDSIHVLKTRMITDPPKYFTGLLGGLCSGGDVNRKKNDSYHSGSREDGCIDLIN